MKIDPNAPVFPGQEFSSEVGANSHLERGLTIRAHFAAMAMQGMVRRFSVSQESDEHIALDARDAVRYADALIAELNK